MLPMLSDQLEIIDKKENAEITHRIMVSVEKTEINAFNKTLICHQFFISLKIICYFVFWLMSTF